MKANISRSQISASVDIRVINNIREAAKKENRSFSELVDLALAKLYPPKKEVNK